MHPTPIFRSHSMTVRLIRIGNPPGDMPKSTRAPWPLRHDSHGRRGSAPTFLLAICAEAGMECHLPREW